MQPVQVEASGPITSAVIASRLRGQLHLTIIVKATFAFVPDGDMTLAEPEPLVVDEQRYENHPARSVRATTDLVPYLRAADVVLTGRAHAPRGERVRHQSVRLAVFRDEAPLLDKTLHVFGDRKAGGEPEPFESMPIRLERAYGGPGCTDNPLGVGFPGNGPLLHNVVDPADPRGVASFGPISRAFHARKSLLRPDDRAALEKPVLDLWEGFDWGYFQAAPPEQRVPFLRGDEWIVLEGLDPEHASLRSRLPGVRATAHTLGLAGPDTVSAVALHADTLRIDADRRSCSLVWRAMAPVVNEVHLTRTRVACGLLLRDATGMELEVEGPASVSRPAPIAQAIADERTATLPELREKVATMPFAKAATPHIGAETMTIDPEDIVEVEDEPIAGAPGRDEPGLTGTMALSPEDFDASAARPLPFASAAAAPGSASVRADIPGAPWSSQSAPPPAFKPHPLEGTQILDTPVAAPLPPPPAPPPPAQDARASEPPASTRVAARPSAPPPPPRSAPPPPPRSAPPPPPAPKVVDAEPDPSGPWAAPAPEPSPAPAPPPPRAAPKPPQSAAAARNMLYGEFNRPKKK